MRAVVRRALENILRFEVRSLDGMVWDGIWYVQRLSDS